MTRGIYCSSSGPYLKSVSTGNVALWKFINEQFSRHIRDLTHILVFTLPQKKGVGEPAQSPRPCSV